ncbi:hypothetical protein Plhal304r1_c014g0053341 [Plasmopara halstedii]
MIKSWRTYVKIQQQRQSRILFCVVTLNSVADQCILRFTIQSWMQIVIKERLYEAALSDWEGVRARKMIHFWSKWSREQHKRKQDVMKAKLHYSKQLEKSTFFYWQSYILAWKDITQPRRKRHNSNDTSKLDDRRPTTPTSLEISLKILRSKKHGRYIIRQEMD